MMYEIVRSAVVSALVSGIVGGIVFHYIQIYIDGKRKESEERAQRRRIERRKADVLEQQRRHANGRVLFWMHDAIKKGVEHANGDLEHAFQEYNAAEAAQKNYEQELLAEHADENRG